MVEGFLGTIAGCGPETISQVLKIGVGCLPVIFLFLVVFVFACENGKEEYGRDEDVHADRVQVTHPPARDIFFCEKARASDQVL